MDASEKELAPTSRQFYVTDRGSIIDGDGYVLIDSDGVFNDEEAEVLVHRANNHDSLLAALKALLDATSQSVIDRASVDAAQHEAYLAIQKAEAK